MYLAKHRSCRDLETFLSFEMLQNIAVTKEVPHQPLQGKKYVGRIQDHLWQWSTNERHCTLLEVTAECVHITVCYACICIRKYIYAYVRISMYKVQICFKQTKKSYYISQEFSIHFPLFIAMELCLRTENAALDILYNCYFSHLPYAHL